VAPWRGPKRAPDQYKPTTTTFFKRTAWPMKNQLTSTSKNITILLKTSEDYRYSLTSYLHQLNDLPNIVRLPLKKTMLIA
jgi:hypothetical protein